MSRWVGHYFINYDRPAIHNVLLVDIPLSSIVDTLVVSRVTNYLRSGGHSLGSWGEELGIKKEYSNVTAEFFQSYSKELEDRCISDVEINYLLYHRLKKFIDSPVWQDAIQVEHEIAQDTYELHLNGFGFDKPLALQTLDRLSLSLSSLDKIIKGSFPPRLRLVREVTPRETKHGTIARNSIPKDCGCDFSVFSVGASFSHCRWEEFNPGSVKQVVERLNEAGWKPVIRTKGHIQAIKDKAPAEKLAHYRVYGWTISEENLSTLPEHAPVGARKLAERLMLASRCSDLQEWINAAQEAKNGEWRIHPNVSGIGAWTGRMSHSNPNTANIPTRKPQDAPAIAALNDLLRTMWIAGRGKLLVGVDADQIQLRILAHYMQDETFTQALITGNKELGTDVHSLNVKAIGPACKGRRDAKTFIYAWLLGAGIVRVSDILGCNQPEARDARERFVKYYPGLKHLKEEVIAKDARLGYFQGLDGRYVYCYGDDYSQRRHYMLGGYLQNGEKVVMAHARRIAKRQLQAEGILKYVKLVNFVHDEYQLEVPDDIELATHVSRVIANSIGLAGDYLGTRCPMKGSVNNGHDKLAIGRTWLETH